MRRRSALERLQARWITGPPGHLTAFLADLGVLAWVLGRAWARGRLDARRAGRRARRS